MTKEAIGNAPSPIHVYFESRVNPPWQKEDDSPILTNVRVFVTAPEGTNLVVVRLDTNVDGLFGLGCATFAYRSTAVVTVIQDYLAPRLIGRHVGDITDVFQTLSLGPYWRNGPIENNALSGIDMALWDIKGKIAGLPVWSLFGGRVREYLPIYKSVFEPDEERLIKRLAKMLEGGDSRFRVVIEDQSLPALPPFYGESFIAEYVRLMVRLRKEFGPEPDFIIDVHGRLKPNESIRLARELEPYRPFFYEDPVSVDDLGWLSALRAQTNLPIAIGEVFTNVNEYLPLISSRSVDYIRCHITAIGGVSQARTLASTAQLFGVKTAWHGPADLSPIGHAANAALDISSLNFGIHEHHEPSPITQEVFPGAPTSARGRLIPSSEPGWGVGFDEKLASRFPPVEPNKLSRLECLRGQDGAIQHP